MKTRKVILSLLAVFTVSIQILSAQPPPPQGGSTGAPLDKGVIFLLLAVVYYGYQKLKEQETPATV